MTESFTGVTTKLSEKAEAGSASNGQSYEKLQDKQKLEEKRMKKLAKRGRRPAKVDLKSKLERSRQSARECRARKKLRYQYLEEIVTNREKAIFALREELNLYKAWAEEVDAGVIPEGLSHMIETMEQEASTEET